MLAAGMNGFDCAARFDNNEQLGKTTFIFLSARTRNMEPTARFGTPA